MVHTMTGYLEMAENLLKNWHKKYTAADDKAPMAMMAEEIKALRLENAELKMERDTLKEVAACVAMLQKWNIFYLWASRILESKVGRTHESIEKRVLPLETNARLTWET